MQRWVSSASGEGCALNSIAQKSANATGLRRTCHEKARRMLYAATALPVHQNISESLIV